MANINTILEDLKRVIADLTVDNSILKAELAERDEKIQQLEHTLADHTESNKDDSGALGQG